MHVASTLTLISHSPPPVELGRVFLNIIWRIMYLRLRFGPRARTVLSTINVTVVLRQVSVEWAEAPAFGYTVRELVLTNHRLQFGWWSSPGFSRLSSAALEHAHRHTSYDDVVVMEQGRTATEHVLVTPPKATDGPAPLPPGRRVSRGRGGRRSPFSYYTTYATGFWWRYNGGPIVGAVDARSRVWRRTITGFLG